VRIVGADLAEFLKYLWLILGGDPDAGVTDRYLYRTIGLPGFNVSFGEWEKIPRL
jgi:hypothetical protein